MDLKRKAPALAFAPEDEELLFRTAVTSAKRQRVDAIGLVAARDDKSAAKGARKINAVLSGRDSSSATGSPAPAGDVKERREATERPVETLRDRLAAKELAVERDILGKKEGDYQWEDQTDVSPRFLSGRTGRRALLTAALQTRSHFNRRQTFRQLAPSSLRCSTRATPRVPLFETPPSASDVAEAVSCTSIAVLLHDLLDLLFPARLQPLGPSQRRSPRPAVRRSTTPGRHSLRQSATVTEKRKTTEVGISPQLNPRTGVGT